MNRIRDWHIIISGYTQDKGYVHGCVRLFQRLLSHNGPATRVELLEWDEDWADFAAYIQSLSEWNARIYVYAYSWGCGNGLVQLAAELDKRGIKIHRAVLSDPVYRSSWFDPIPGLGHLMRGLGVLRRGTIKLPPNILHVDRFYQDGHIPAGCELEPTGPDTVFGDSIKLNFGHEQMDDAEAWHRKCEEVAAA